MKTMDNSNVNAPHIQGDGTALNISLCLIVWDQLDGCKQDVPGLPRDEFCEVFAIDGGSTDGTVEYLQAQGIPVHRQVKKGLNAAYVHANRLSRGDATVAFFPKGTVPPEDLRKFRPLFQRGEELVIASRQITGSVNEEDTKRLRPRKWAVRCLAILAAVLWRREGHWVRDVLHGIKGWRRDAFERMKILEYGLSIDLEMVVRAYKLRIPRAEFATTESLRRFGATRFRFWSTGKRLLGYLWFELRRKD
jgi:glycosyltransferase involved in cell wall biosynthesis